MPQGWLHRRRRSNGNVLVKSFGTKVGVVQKFLFVVGLVNSLFSLFDYRVKEVLAKLIGRD